MAREQVVRVAGYGFAYPSAAAGAPAQAVLEGVNLAVEKGAFCVLAGPTGCGKTTLLRSLKPELAPAGERRGSVRVLGRALVEGGRAAEGTDARWSAAEIGYVMQDPAAQIVCDTVWHELAFGLESLGAGVGDMRRRVAEVAHFFGIEPWVGAGTETLSGGQKQLVNLAAVLALRPGLLLLDEPTAQLDPVAREQFTAMLGRVNRELGITVVMATHAPEEVEGLATQRVNLGREVPRAPRAAVEKRLLAPRWARWERACAAAGAPAGRGHAGAMAARGGLEAPARAGEVVLAARDVFFRYDRAGAWVLRGLSAEVRAGGVHAFVGGNGCGKSTLLRVLAGADKPQRGRVDSPLASSQALLPQDPKALLVCDTVADELAEWRGRCGYAPADERAMLERFGLAGLADHHPYDLSGGQQQKLALAKVLLAAPRLLFLDEPTKGLDPCAAADVARELTGLADEGRTVVLVTHDLDFALACAEEVSLVFDGEVACTEPAPRFFAGSLLYRPSDSARLYGALLAGEDDENEKDEAEGGCSEDGGAGAADGASGAASTAGAASAGAPRTDGGASRARVDSPGGRPRTLSRVFGAVLEVLAVGAVPAVLAFCAVTRVQQAALLSLVVVLAAIALFFSHYERRAPRLRDVMPAVVLAACAAAGRVLFAPLPNFKPVSAIAIMAGAVFGRQSGFMVGALAALVSNFFLGQGPWTPWQMYAWGLVGYLAGVLAQVGAFRGASEKGAASGVPGVLGTVAGASELGAAASAARPAQECGPQAARAGAGASAPNAGRSVRSSMRRVRSAIRSLLRAWPLCLYGFLSGPLYGVVLNLWSIIGFYHPQTASQLAAVYAAALPFDIAHGVATVAFLLVLYAPWCRKLARVKRAYGLR